jgi:hypothetical protein
MSAFSLSLGKGKTGLTLNAQKTDVSGVNIDTPITSGFTEIGDGFYIWNYSLESNFEGCVKFIDENTNEVLAFTSINPNQLSPNALDLIEIENNVNLKEALIAMAAVLAGKAYVSGDTVTFKGINTNTTRVESTTTASGQRTAVALTL